MNSINSSTCDFQTITFKAILSAQTIINRLSFDFRQFSVAKFASYLETKRGRQLIFFAGYMPPPIDGIWLSDHDYPLEYIFYERTLVPIHKTHTQLHEIAHYLLGHKTRKIGQGDLGRWHETMFQSTLFRCLRQDKIEVEAEFLATMLQLEATKNSHGSWLPHNQKEVMLDQLHTIQNAIQQLCPPTITFTPCWYPNLDVQLHRAVINILDGRRILENALHGHGFAFINSQTHQQAQTLCQSLAALQRCTTYPHFFTVCRNLLFHTSEENAYDV